MQNLKDLYAAIYNLENIINKRRISNYNFLIKVGFFMMFEAIVFIALIMNYSGDMIFIRTLPLSLLFAFGLFLVTHNNAAKNKFIEQLVLEKI